MRTLHDIGQLKSSGFGRPAPRHGLKLLYWFTKECVDQNFKKLSCDPAYGDFGFHPFQNRCERGSKLLPEVSNTPLHYYEVGNLHKYQSNVLPLYVREDYHQNSGPANKDRVIVSVNTNGCFEKVYVTTHSGQSQFDLSATYEIHRQLLKSIKGMSLDDFLTQSGYQTQNTANVSSNLGNSGTCTWPGNPPPQTSVPQATSSYTTPVRRASAPLDEERRCQCTIL